MTTAKVTVEQDENIFSKMVTYAETNSDTIYTSTAILTILAYVVNTQMMVNLALWVVVLLSKFPQPSLPQGALPC